MPKVLGKKRAASLLVVLAVICCVIMAAMVFASKPVEKSKLAITPVYRGLDVSWADSVTSGDTSSTGVYLVFRAENANGKNATRLAHVDASKTHYQDFDLIPGASWSYAVLYGVNQDAISDVTTSSLIWTDLKQVRTAGPRNADGTMQETPHKGESANSRNNKSCKRCHDVHDGPATATNLLVTSQNATEPNARVALCLGCHLQSDNIEYAFVNTSLTANKGHTIKNAQNPDGVLECVTCHDTHRSSKGAKGALVSTTVLKFGNLSNPIRNLSLINPNAACTGCHDDANTWYNAVENETEGQNTYPSTADPQLLSGATVESGYYDYPIRGTYPGASVSNRVTKNAHANIKAGQNYDRGDCRYCHSAHANGATDQLLTQRGELRRMKSVDGVVSDDEITSASYASYCLSCHNGDSKGTPWETAPDIAQYVQLPAGSSEASRTAFIDKARSGQMGHTIVSAGADMAINSELPCYDCHNVHGSNTNAKNFADTRGKNLKNNNDFCFTCHLSADGFACVDGDKGAVVAYSDLPKKKKTIYGLARKSKTVSETSIPGNPSDYLQLTAKDVAGVDVHSAESTRSCSTPECHGSSHSPAKEDAGTIGCGAKGHACTECHSDRASGEYAAAASLAGLERDTTAGARATNKHTPHLFAAWLHVTATGDVDLASSTATKTAYYATSNSDKGAYCIGCHAWSDTKLRGGKGGEPGGDESGFTLRTVFNGTEVTNRDYLRLMSSIIRVDSVSLATLRVAQLAV